MSATNNPVTDTQEGNSQDRTATLTLLPLDEIGTAECRSWRKRATTHLGEFKPYIEKQYQYLATTQDYVKANQWLSKTVERMDQGQTGLKLDSPMEAVKDYARAKAKSCETTIHEAFQRLGAEGMLELVSQLVNKTGIPFPLSETEDPTKHQKVVALAKVCNELWWRKKIRTKQWREQEALAREMGLVSLNTGPYVSNFTFRRRWLQKNENRSLLEAMEATNEEGATYLLSELADRSTSNPAIRRSEMMVRSRGSEEFAKHSDVPYQAMFYTITCPSKFHATLHHGGPNPKYQGATPREAQQYLTALWGKARAAFGRENIHPFGMRVAEPHHDGTPHWHLLLFIPADQAARATTILERYALAEDGDEPGAALRRFTVKAIDPNEGSATGYIAKYISKNIDGFGIDADSYGRDAKESAIRIEAWASVWGIRQFQQIGGASVTVWRELRRLEASTEDKELLRQLITAADNSDWEEYTRLMGGAVCPRKERPLRPMMIIRETLNKYGEAVKTLKGLFYGPEQVITRVHEWTVRLVSQNDSQKSEEAEASGIQSDHIGHTSPYLLAPPENFAPLEFCQ